MLSTSFAFRRFVSEGGHLENKVELALADGTVHELSGADLALGGVTFSAGTSSASGFDIGAAIVGSCEVVLANYDGRWDDTTFTGATATVSLGARLEDGTVEWLRKGVYGVQQPESYDSTIALEGHDAMRLFKEPYAGVATAYPATLRTIVADVCRACGVSQLSASFPNDSQLVPARPDGANASCLDVLAWAAQMAGCFADVDPWGRLRVRWYATSAFEAEDWLDGGTYSTAATPYSDGDAADGGWFHGGGDAADGGGFQQAPWAVVTAIKSLTVATDDVVVTGVRVTASPEVLEDGTQGADGESYLYGAEGYVLAVEDNPLVAYGHAQEVAGAIGPAVVGMRFRPLSVTALGDPAIEAGDPLLVVDRRNRTFRAWATSITWKQGGSQSISCDAETPARNMAATYSAATRAIVAQRNAVRAERTAREQALADLSEQLSNSSGLYETDQEQQDGSIIRYFHDKPTLAESQIVWKFTANAFGISSDGGATYPYGMDVSGRAMLDRIYTIGLDADHINAGAFTVRDPATGATVFSADIGTGEVVIGARTPAQINDMLEDAITDVSAQYRYSDSATELTGSGPGYEWQAAVPTWVDGTYIWRRTVTTANGVATPSDPACISGPKGETGAAGDPATVYEAHVSPSSVARDQDGAITPQAITFSATSRSGDGAPAAYAGRFLVDTSQDGSSWTGRYSSSADEASGSYAPTAAVLKTARYFRVRLFAAGGLTTELDSQTVPIISDGSDGGDAYTVLLTNESHTFAATADGKAITDSTSCSVIAYKGAERVPAYITSISGAPNGMATRATSSGTVNAGFTVSVEPAMTTRSGTLAVSLTIDGKTFDATFSYALAVAGSAGAAGDPATVYEAHVSPSSVARDQDGAITPQAITFSATSRSGDGAPAAYAGRFLVDTSQDGSSWTGRYSSSADEASGSYAPTAAVLKTARYFRVRLFAAGGLTTELDSQTVPIISDGSDGGDAYTVLLTNESHTFAATADGKAITDSTSCSVIAYKGAERVPAYVLSITGTPNGMTTRSTSSGTVNAGFTVSVGPSMTTRSGTLSVSLMIDGKTFEVTFSYALATAGSTGPTGVGISDVEEQWLVSTLDGSSSSQTPTGAETGWGSGQPVWESGKYIWSRSRVTWTDGSVTTTAPVLARAVNGANEAAHAAAVAVDSLDTSLDAQGVFDRLTAGGTIQGIFLENGQLYVNAEYIRAGSTLVVGKVAEGQWNTVLSANSMAVRKNADVHFSVNTRSWTYNGVESVYSSLNMPEFNLYSRDDRTARMFSQMGIGLIAHDSATRYDKYNGYSSYAVTVNTQLDANHGDMPALWLGPAGTATDASGSWYASLNASSTAYLKFEKSSQYHRDASASLHANSIGVYGSGTVNIGGGTFARVYSSFTSSNTTYSNEIIVEGATGITMTVPYPKTLKVQAATITVENPSNSSNTAIRLPSNLSVIVGTSTGYTGTVSNPSSITVKNGIVTSVR